jgi:hypothetical protein
MRAHGRAVGLPLPHLGPSRARRVLPAILGLVLGAGLLGIPAGPTGPVAVRAAAPDLTIVTQARYDVQPAQRRVRLTLDLTLTNRRHDTKTARYYFDQAFLAVLPGTSGYRLTWAGAATPTVRVSRRTSTFTVLRLGLPARLYSGKTASYRLRFDLVDPGGAPTRDLRIGDSLASFPVWAFATDGTPGSSSTVVFPAGYDVQVEAGSIPPPEKLRDGRTVFRTGVLQDPLKFFAYLVGDRPGAYRERKVTATVSGKPVQLVVRSWPDDRPWEKRVGNLLARGLPALGREIGLPWPRTAPLTVQEAVSRTTGGYAGLFDPSANRVEIAYYADPFVILHEAAHGWFNGALLADRWANEAFASYYAARAATDLKIKVQPDVLTAKLRKSAIPLNAWGPVHTDSSASEDYAYAASLTLARAIAKRAGANLAAVWADVSAHVGAYQPPNAAVEPMAEPADWRVLLDLLEEHTGTAFDDLWRTWVARPDDLPLLDARTTARARYAAVLARAGDWHLPSSIRAALRAWQFETATTQLDAAAAVLDQRAQVQAAAAAAGLTAPTNLRVAFENDDRLDDAAAEATAELTAIASYERAAVLRRPVDVGTPVVLLGMLGQAPDADLAVARDAFAAGDLQRSVSASAAAATTWGDAEAIGRGRVVSLILLLLAALLAVGLITSRLRGHRRRRRRHRMMATPQRPEAPTSHPGQG